MLQASTVYTCRTLSEKWNKRMTGSNGIMFRMEKSGPYQEGVIVKTTRRHQGPWRKEADSQRERS